MSSNTALVACLVACLLFLGTMFIAGALAPDRNAIRQIDCVKAGGTNVSGWSGWSCQPAAIRESKP